MFRRLKRFLLSHRDDIDLDPAKGRISPVTIRVYGEEDFNACRELYLLNEPSRFPAGILPEFEKSLKTNNSLTLVVVKDGQVCGCGGISIRQQSGASIAWLSFGLIHPRHHGQGLGTTSLLARVSLLPEHVRYIALAPVPASRGFYERFHFRECLRHTWPNGEEFAVLRARFPSGAAHDCATLLAKAGVVLNAPSFELPITVV